MNQLLQQNALEDLRKRIYIVAAMCSVELNDEAVAWHRFELDCLRREYREWQSGLVSYTSYHDVYELTVNEESVPCLI